jgi:hypothetical protein
MTTENTVTVVETVSANDNVESKPSRSREQQSADRIAYHVALSAEKRARLETLKPGKAYDRCLKSIEANDAFIAELQAGVTARAEKKSSKAA